MSVRLRELASFWDDESIFKQRWLMVSHQEKRGQLPQVRLRLPGREGVDQRQRLIRPFRRQLAGGGDAVVGLD